ncbi:MAG: type II secretion system F family protein [Lachnospiraceae bacterium]
MELPRYKYSAKNQEGKLVQGFLEAADEDALYQKLREQDQFLISASKKEAHFSEKKLKPAILSDFCRQIGTLLSAGVSLVRALNIMAEDHNLKPAVARIYQNLLRLIRQGIPLSDAMEQQGAAFPELLINMFRSAEASGSIDKTAKRMAVHYEKEHKMNGKVVSAMMYPMILIVLVFVVVIFIVSYVIPQFQTIFATMKELPLPTRIILGVSGAIQNHWIMILVIAVIAVITIILLFRIPIIRLYKDKFKLKIPLIGKLLRTIYTARFARTLSSLYSSGLPIVTALQVGRKTVGNRYIDVQFDEVIRSIRSGETLSKSLGLIDGFDGKLHATILIGEETGSLDEMLISIADALEYDSEMALGKMVAILEPVLIIIMAVIIGFIMVGVMLPIIKSYAEIEKAAN